MLETSKQQFFKFILKEFYVEKINKKVWDECKKYSIKDNLVFITNQNFDEIKSIVASLIIQNKENIDYLSTSLYNLSASRFNKEIPEFDQLLENKDFLVIYELGDIEVKTYNEILTYTINTRILNNKNNLLIFTGRKPENYLSRDMLDKFKIINLKGDKFKAEKKNSDVN